MDHILQTKLSKSTWRREQFGEKAMIKAITSTWKVSKYANTEFFLVRIGTFFTECRFNCFSTIRCHMSSIKSWTVIVLALRALIFMKTNIQSEAIFPFNVYFKLLKINQQKGKIKFKKHTVTLYASALIWFVKC